MYRDGRFSSEPLTYTFEDSFENLIYVNEKGYDYKHPVFNRIEQKQITRNGFKFCPSKMVGVGRKAEPSVVEQTIRDTDLHYLIPSIIEFPIVHVILLSGIELIKKCTTTSCRFSTADAISKLITPYETESK